MKVQKDKFEINLLRMIDNQILQVESVDYCLKREEIEHKKPFGQEKFLNMLKNSVFPFEGGLSYFFLPNNKLRINGGTLDPYYDKDIVVTFVIQDGYSCKDIDKELNKATVTQIGRFLKNRDD